MISLVIPTFNEEKVIEGTLKKLKEGLRGIPHEIIVSDAKSSDRTIQIAKRYTDRVVVEKKKTIARGRNLGALAARGEYLVFIDADVEIPRPSIFFKKAVSFFEKDKKLAALTAFLKVFPEKATLADKFFFSLVNIYHSLSNNVFGVGSASGEFQMIKTSAFRRVGGYREDLTVSEDNELFQRLSKVGRTRISPSLLVFHSGRRAHTLGWPRLLFEWLKNMFSLLFRRKSSSQEWEAIR